ncbi:MAG TPA: PaeR7I family type II restriction endonuclease [Tepidiformaceae bacterium]|nr:PaeR7I family type II restriction endonuclease [Tepidiformaceae bacterium]
MISDADISLAVAHFWGARKTGTQAATHDRAFLQLIARELELLGWEPHIAEGVGDARARVGGHFRASKSWDIVCRDNDGELRICVEFKSQVDSYGNNENNRYEEAMGSGLDVRARYGPSVAIGFVLVLCEEEATRRPTALRHIEILPEFRDTSHIQRRSIFARRLTEFRLNEMSFYDAAAVLFVGRDGTHTHPDEPRIDLRTFVGRLLSRFG